MHNLALQLLRHSTRDPMCSLCVSEEGLRVTPLLTPNSGLTLSDGYFSHYLETPPFHRS